MKNYNKVALNLDVILMISSNIFVNSIVLSSLINPKSDEIKSCVSTSYAEPIAISKNRAKSLFEFLEDPSAIFEGTET